MKDRKEAPHVFRTRGVKALEIKGVISAEE